jgi:L-idonate 5-dehydrogenase
MLAAILHAPRDLRIEDLPEAAPGPGQVSIRIRSGGICGSDMHYYLHGGFGTVRLQEPMVLGHEIAGEVLATGPGVTSVQSGDRVAVNPGLPCGHCRYCLEGRANQCLDMRFYGSAMRMPHVQGGFRQQLVCAESQAVKLPPTMSFETAAFAEPLAVCLHAAAQAGPLQGRRVLVTGTGPIGALAILVARHGGAREVVATDLSPAPLALARRIGADLALDLKAEPGALERFSADKGHFDVVFEASGSGAALAGAIQAARPGATIVQLGLGGEVPLPVNTLVAKEIALKGTFRFDAEFAWATEFLASGAINVAPLLTEVVPLRDATRAFELAADRSRAMKVQLSF